MATSITKLSIGIEGDATPVLGTIDQTKSALGKLGKDANKIGAGSLRRAFGGLGGDIGGKFAEEFGGSMFAGLAIGGGIGGLVATASNLLGPALSSIGQGIADFVTGKHAEQVAAEMKKGAEWAQKWGQNVGTTSGLVQELGRHSGFLASHSSLMARRRIGTELATRATSFQRTLGVTEDLRFDTSDPTSFGRVEERLREARSSRLAGMTGSMTDISRGAGDLGFAQARFENPMGGQEDAERALMNAGMLRDTIGMTADEAERYRLRMLGASEATLTQLGIAQRVNEARRLTESTRSPMARFATEETRLNNLLRDGLISSEVHALGIADAMRSLPTAPELKAGSALMAGSQDALSAITKFQLQGARGRNPVEERLAAARADERTRTEAARETVRLLREARDRPTPVVGLI